MTAVPTPTSPTPLAAPHPARHAPRALSMRANFSWTLAGNAVYALSQLGVLVLLAKLLSATAVGTYALANAVTSPVFFFFSLKLRGAQATDVGGAHPFRDYLALRLATTVLAVAVAAAMAAFGGHATHTAVAILMVALAKSAEAVSDVLHGLFQLHERMDLGAKAMVVKGPLSLVAMAAAVFFTRSLAWGLVAMACALAAVLLAYELPLARRVNRRAAEAAGGARGATGAGPDDVAGARPLARGVWSLALLTFPLGVTLALVALWQNMPRYFLARSFGEREVGIFTAVVSPLMAGGLIVTALAQSAAPRLARYHAEGRGREFDKLLLKLMGIGAALGAAGVVVSYLIGEPVLRLVYSEEYARHAEALVLVAFGTSMAFTYIFCASALNAMRRFKVQVPIYAASLVMMAAACAGFVPRYGIRGAAFAMLTAYAGEGAIYFGVMFYQRRRGAKPNPSGADGADEGVAALEFGAAGSRSNL